MTEITARAPGPRRRVELEHMDPCKGRHDGRFELVGFDLAPIWPPSADSPTLGYVVLCRSLVKRSVRA
jgi:hypothetical protein